MRNSRLKTFLKGISAVTASFLILLTFYKGNIYAATITPSVIDVFIQRGAQQGGEFTYKNTSDKELLLVNKLYQYDSRNLAIKGDENIFVTLENDEVEAKAGEKVGIKYTVNIPQKTPIGTYFNVAALVEQQKYNILSNDSNFDIKKGEGVLFAIHVMDETGEMNSEALQITITPERKWFVSSFIPTNAELTVTNTSPYAISVLGEVRVISTEGQVIDTIRLSQAGQRLYPDETVTKEIEIKPSTFEDLNLVYSLTSNMTTHWFTGEFALTNYASAIIWSFIFTLSAVLTALLIYKKRKEV